MDIEALEFRAGCIQAAREFFITNNYLELDTPCLAKALIPENCLEVFKTEYINPFGKKISSENNIQKNNEDLFLVPSPEVYMKPVIAKTKRSVFQISKCFRNAESKGNIHSPEFTMLEYYTVNANYIDSIKITEKFLNFVAQKVKSNILFDTNILEIIKDGFECLTMDEAFRKYAGIPLSVENSAENLAYHAERLGLGSADNYKNWMQDDLYELILVHAVEPNLPKNKIIAILDYPAFVPCLAVEKKENIIEKNKTYFWNIMERWEIYLNGVELANCYTEQCDKDKINKYFYNEDLLKKKTAYVKHPAIQNFGNICAEMPHCSGVALGFDRLIMLLAGKKTLSSFLY